MVKNIVFIILFPLIVLLCGAALFYYFFTKNDTPLEIWNDVFETFWI